jgi:hypothetical protein
MGFSFKCRPGRYTVILGAVALGRAGRIFSDDSTAKS